MIEIISIKGEQPGKKLLILGAIHGNETCGTYAIQEIIQKINEHKIIIKRGSISCIPICNPKAYKAGQRYIEKNLNRTITYHKNPLWYEDLLANEIIKQIKKCDYILDLHSMQSK
jgi:predicted deacylase